jgi:hypothetical protein
MNRGKEKKWVEKPSKISSVQERRVIGTYSRSVLNPTGNFGNVNSRVKHPSLLPAAEFGSLLASGKRIHKSGTA